MKQEGQQPGAGPRLGVKPTLHVEARRRRRARGDNATLLAAAGAGFGGRARQA